MTVRRLPDGRGQVGGQDYLKKSLWMKQELRERGCGGLLVTVSKFPGEHSTYSRDRARAVEDTVQLSMPMKWRFVRGRGARLRGPVLFTFDKQRNAAVLDKGYKGFSASDGRWVFLRWLCRR